MTFRRPATALGIRLRKVPLSSVACTLSVPMSVGNSNTRERGSNDCSWCRYFRLVNGSLWEARSYGVGGGATVVAIRSSTWVRSRSQTSGALSIIFSAATHLLVLLSSDRSASPSMPSARVMRHAI
jgi:hypothetical protein